MLLFFSPRRFGLMERQGKLTSTTCVLSEMDTEGFEWLIPDLVESNNVTANAVCDELRILVLQKERHS